MAGRPVGTHSPVDLEGVHYYLSTKKYPETVGKTHGKKANFRRQANKFTLVDGKLHKYRGKRDKKLRVIIDQEERQRILRSVHEGEDENLEPKERNRHFGQDKTEVRLLDKYWWPGIRGDVRKFVNACRYCQCHKTDRKGLKVNFTVEADMSPVPLPTHPWEQIGIEVCHMPKSKEGFSFLAIVIDYFSVWIEAKPLAAKTPENVADFLYHLLCRHGCADIQIIDSDKEFAGQVSDHLYCMVGARQNITSAYHSQASELFDTYSNMIQDLLMKVLNNPTGVDNWPKALPGVLFTFRTNSLPSSGFSPFYLLYGRYPKLPVSAELEVMSDGHLERERARKTDTIDMTQDSDAGSSGVKHGRENSDLSMTVEDSEPIMNVESCGTGVNIEQDDSSSIGDMDRCGFDLTVGDCGQRLNTKDCCQSMKVEPEDCDSQCYPGLDVENCGQGLKVETIEGGPGISVTVTDSSPDMDVKKSNSSIGQCKCDSDCIPFDPGLIKKPGTNSV